MAVQPILQLGNPLLYQVCDTVDQTELDVVRNTVADLHDTMMAFRREHGVGRAIAAPQIGVMKKIVYMNVDGNPVTFVNPVLDRLSNERMVLWDDCMSFPELLVKVERYKTCRITFRDLSWQECTMSLRDDLSELLQHECDHLDGVLALSRAIDGCSFSFRHELTGNTSNLE